MLAQILGGSEPTPNDEDVRRAVEATLAALGPLLLDASRAADSPEPRAAILPLRRAALLLRSLA